MNSWQPYFQKRRRGNRSRITETAIRSVINTPRRGEDEDLWRWSRLEIRQNSFLRSTIPQKQFIKQYLSYVNFNLIKRIKIQKTHLNQNEITCEKSNLIITLSLPRVCAKLSNILLYT